MAWARLGRQRLLVLFKVLFGTLPLMGRVLDTQCALTYHCYSKARRGRQLPLLATIAVAPELTACSPVKPAIHPSSLLAPSGAHLRTQGPSENTFAATANTWLAMLPPTDPEPLVPIFSGRWGRPVISRPQATCPSGPHPCCLPQEVSLYLWFLPCGPAGERDPPGLTLKLG